MSQVFQGLSYDSLELLKISVNSSPPISTLKSFQLFRDTTQPQHAKYGLSRSKFQLTTPLKAGKIE